MRTDRSLVIWAVLGPFMGLGLGLTVGWAAWGGAMSRRVAPPPAETPRARTPKVSPPTGPAVAPRAAKGEPKQSDREPEPPELDWADYRAELGCRLAYCFENAGEPPAPRLAGLIRGDDPAGLLLKSDGPVAITAAGATFADGSKLYSEQAGRTLSRLIKKSGAFTVETLVRPADGKHRGPARIVSISQDGGQRNFTLGQENDRWVVRLRTSKTGANGTSPEVRVPGLSRRLTHVVVTFDGRTERIYLNGSEAKSSTEVAGSLDSWAEGFPLVLGNEFKDRRDWAGSIQLVAFYFKALSAEDVRKLLGKLPAGGKVPAAANGPGEGEFF